MMEQMNKQLFKIKEEQAMTSNTVNVLTHDVSRLYETNTQISQGGRGRGRGNQRGRNTQASRRPRR